MSDGELQLYSLFSGSKGNCTFFATKEGGFLIDAGKSRGAIEKALDSLGYDFGFIRGIFITHEHYDHVKALDLILSKYDIPVHMTKKSYINRSPSLADNEGKIILHEAEYEEICCGAKISSFPVPHDSALCVGYTVSYGGKTVGITTDIGRVTPEVFRKLCRCNAVMIESNHCEKMLKEGGYSPALKERILSSGGHLSNGMCAQTIKHLRDSGVDRFMLAHLSENNNTPERALDAVREALGARAESTLVQTAGGDICKFFI